jgi:hypothetical protein
MLAAEEIKVRRRMETGISFFDCLEDTECFRLLRPVDQAIAAP